jgi:DNA topoisomerase-1
MQKKCTKCGGLISPEKLKFFPDTNICSAKCANQVKKNEESIQNKISNVKTQSISVKQPNSKCDKCDGVMLPREGRWGEFLGCSNYPKCNNTINIKKN